jgi:hypothetical protein
MPKRPVLGVAVACLLSASCVCLTTPSASAATHKPRIYLFPRLNTYGDSGYQVQTYRPRTINLPDDLQAVHIRWTDWGASRATGVGHVMGEPHNILRFEAAQITNDARRVASCASESGPVPAIRYYSRLTIHAASRALEVNDEVSGNFASRPTIQC